MPPVRVPRVVSPISIPNAGPVTRLRWGIKAAHQLLVDNTNDGALGVAYGLEYNRAQEKRADVILARRRARRATRCHQPSLLDRLPVELLVQIRNDFDELDFVTHAGFLLASSLTDALYDEISDQYWLHAISFNGLSAMAPADRYNIWHGHRDEQLKPEREWDWELMALEYAEHISGCTHPACGRRLLQENVANMTWAFKQPWWRDKLFIGSENAYKGIISSMPAFGRLALLSTLSHHSVDLNDMDALLRFAVLRPPAPSPFNADALSTYPMETLANHPILARSFATCPPMESLVVMPLPRVPGDRVYNPDFLTVQDVVGKVAQKLAGFPRGMGKRPRSTQGQSSASEENVASASSSNTVKSKNTPELLPLGPLHVFMDSCRPSWLSYSLLEQRNA